MYPATGDPRQDHSQSVHLHMHHFCPCLNMVYPYPSAYRPPIVSYAHTRPYNLHHYQYTQFNMLPYGGNSTTVLPQPPMNLFPNPNLGVPNAPVGGDAVFGPPPRDRNRTTEGGETEKTGTTNECGDFVGLPTTIETILPPAADTTDAFIKFLEDSCLRAEHIAYRNRNRPCFRNIQNLCMRTRSEIVKPCTTISNIHSQGIPWATKDFIYAFIRLVNCWHILKGYLEKGGSLGKIEKELTADFKACYYRWEKDSIELAGELRKIFCNLDANISNSSYHNQKSNGSEMETEAAATQADLLANKSGRKSTNSSDTTNDGDSHNDGRVYMKPGSYNVPKRNSSTNNSPRSYEFLETAQNVHRRMNADKQEVTDRMWKSAQTAAPNLISKMTTSELELSKREELSFKDFLPEGADVQTWINTGLYDIKKEMDEEETKSANNSPTSSKPITVLQRAKCGKACEDERRQYKSENHRVFCGGKKNGSGGGGGFKETVGKFKDILGDLKTTEFSLYFSENKVTRFRCVWFAFLNAFVVESRGFARWLIEKTSVIINKLERLALREMVLWRRYSQTH